MEPIEFAAGPDVGCEESGGVEDVSRAFGLSDWKDGVAINRDGEAVGEAGVQGESRRSVLYVIGLGCLVDFQMGIPGRQLEILVWNSGLEISFRAISFTDGIQSLETV